MYRFLTGQLGRGPINPSLKEQSMWGQLPGLPSPKAGAGQDVRKICDRFIGKELRKRTLRYQGAQPEGLALSSLGPYGAKVGAPSVAIEGPVTFL